VSVNAQAAIDILPLIPLLRRPHGKIFNGGQAQHNPTHLGNQVT
jgi:hypothetical protein